LIESWLDYSAQRAIQLELVARGIGDDAQRVIAEDVVGTDPQRQRSGGGLGE
jgi:hypothetical protein